MRPIAAPNHTLRCRARVGSRTITFLLLGAMRPSPAAAWNRASAAASSSHS
jgi:hypothetical protein